VQVTPGGNFLYFNNLVFTWEKTKALDGGSLFLNNFSEVNEVQPRSYQMVRSFQAQPKETFYSWISANVQQLTEDLWLFTHHLNGTYIYSHAQKKLIRFVPGTHFQEGGFGPSQQVRGENLGDFTCVRNL
jgi:hypothetical protein